MNQMQIQHRATACGAGCAVSRASGGRTPNCAVICSELAWYYYTLNLPKNWFFAPPPTS